MIYGIYREKYRKIYAGQGLYYFADGNDGTGKLHLVYDPVNVNNRGEINAYLKWQMFKH
jgi:hypothetical protein